MYFKNFQRRRRNLAQAGFTMVKTIVWIAVLGIGFACIMGL
jgi:hypothetical protein